MKNIFIEQNLIDKNKSYLQNVYNKLTLSLINVIKSFSNNDILSNSLSVL